MHAKQIRYNQLKNTRNEELPGRVKNPKKSSSARRPRDDSWKRGTEVKYTPNPPYVVRPDSRYWRSPNFVPRITAFRIITSN